MRHLSSQFKFACVGCLLVALAGVSSPNAFAAKTGAFPSTIIYDPAGGEVVRLMRDAHWDTPEAIGLVRAVLNGAR